MGRAALKGHVCPGRIYGVPSRLVTAPQLASTAEGRSIDLPGESGRQVGHPVISAGLRIRVRPRASFLTLV